MCDHRSLTYAYSSRKMIILTQYHYIYDNTKCNIIY